MYRLGNFVWGLWPHRVNRPCEGLVGGFFTSIVRLVNTSGTWNCGKNSRKLNWSHYGKWEISREWNRIGVGTYQYQDFPYLDWILFKFKTNDLNSFISSISIINKRKGLFSLLSSHGESFCYSQMISSPRIVAEDQAIDGDRKIALKALFDQRRKDFYVIETTTKFKLYFFRVLPFSFHRKWFAGI